MCCLCWVRDRGQSEPPKPAEGSSCRLSRSSLDQGADLSSCQIWSGRRSRQADETDGDVRGGCCDDMCDREGQAFSMSCQPTRDARASRNGRDGMAKFGVHAADDSLSECCKMTSRMYIAVCRIAIVIAAAETTDTMMGGNLNGSSSPECSFPSADTARAFLPQFGIIASSCHGQRPQALNLRGEVVITPK